MESRDTGKTGEEIPGEEKKTLYQTLRERILPVKETDSNLVKAGKQTGFVVFAVLFILVSVMIIGAVTFVL